MAKYSRLKKYSEVVRLLRDIKQASLHKAKIYEVVIHWIKNNLTRNQFLVFSGILVGLTSGLAGVLLKLTVHYIHDFITRHFYFEQQIVFYLIFPFVGIVLTTIIVVYLFKGQHRKGIPAILYEIAQNSSKVAPVKMYSQLIQSAVTVGFGGSAGLESPIAVTGAAIGSNFAETYQLGYKERTLLLAAGATAGIAAAFNAPIAGMMFAFEILLTGVVFSDFIPLVVAAVCGSLLSRIILKEEVLFQFTSRHAFDYHNIFFYLVFGVLCGWYARYFLLVARYVEQRFHVLNYSLIKKAMIAGSVLSLLCVLFPPLFGEGYGTVKSLANGNIDQIIENSFFKYFIVNQWVVVLFLVMVCLLKAFATPVTIFGGGNGGNFAPSLFSGAFLGYLFSIICTLLGFTHVPVTNMVIVGMAGVMSGVLYAPLTAIFLIAESSSGYDLFIPLMIVSVISYLIAKWFSPISPDLKLLAEKGQIFTTEHDKNLLLLLHTSNLVEKKPAVLQLNASFANLQTIVTASTQNNIAVVSSDDQLAGIISINDLRHLMFAENAPKLTPAQLMKPPKVIVLLTDSVWSVLHQLDKTASTELPVVTASGAFAGFISKTKILNEYRKLLQEYS